MTDRERRCWMIFTCLLIAGSLAMLPDRGMDECLRGRVIVGALLIALAIPLAAISWIAFARFPPND